MALKKSLREYRSQFGWRVGEAWDFAGVSVSGQSILVELTTYQFPFAVGLEVVASRRHFIWQSSI
jgi:hypothetical protein